MTYDAVLFDFGGVFIDSPFEVATAASERLGVPFDQLAAIVFGPYDDDTDHPWHRLERGEISFAEAQASIVERSREAGLPVLDPIAVLSELAGDGGRVRHFMVEEVRRLRSEGVATGVVTNNIAEFGDYWRSLIPLDELFDDVVDSSAVGIRKPDPRIFQLACGRLGVDAGRAVFLDDHEGNVAGARSAGLAAICCGYSVASTRAAVGELRALLAGGSTRPRS